MRKTGTALFISTPRTYRDLIKPHRIEAESEYKIVKVIELKAIDYENFTEDMLADRQFIEDFASLCPSSKDCILVKRRNHAEGILVIPDGCYVKKAAIIKMEQE